MTKKKKPITRTPSSKKKLVNPNNIIRKKKPKKPLTDKQRFKIRSDAAKRGHETRKLVKDLHKAAYQIAKATKKAKDQNTKDRESRLEAELEEERRHNKELEKKVAEMIEFDLKFSHFVRGEPLANLHRDGTIAVQPTLLRHLDITDQLLDRLRMASDFDNEANLIADEMDVPVREVYTLWESP